MDAIQPIKQTEKPHTLKLLDFHFSGLRQPAKTVHFPLNNLDKQFIQDITLFSGLECSDYNVSINMNR